MIQLLEIKKIYKEKIALDIPKFEFEEGLSYALIGANGSGKSTLIRLLAKTLTYEQGKIILPPKTTTAYMPQKSFGFNLRVIKNLTIVRNDEKTALKLLDALNMTTFSKKNASRLSGGETQKLALARTFMLESNLILLDEPTSAMDIGSSILAENLIKEKSAGKTLIFSTHSIPQAEKLADYIVYLDNGLITEVLPAKEFCKSCQNPATKQFLSHFYKVI